MGYEVELSSRNNVHGARIGVYTHVCTLNIYACTFMDDLFPPEILGSGHRGTMGVSVSSLVVVPCGKRKIWDRYPTAGPTKAEDVYIGPPFKVNREYAEKYGDRWVILSAKYGFIDPNSIIPENYDVTFKGASTSPISIRALKSQIRQKALDRFDTVVVLGGKDYADVVDDAFSGFDVKTKAPVAGLPLGYAMGAVRNAIVPI